MAPPPPPPPPPPSSAFLHGHATHPDWQAALALAAAQVEAGAGPGPIAGLGFVYFSDHYVAQAGPLLDALRQRWPGVSWVGSVGVGVAANGVEYIDEPALVLLIAPLAAADFRVFSGERPLPAPGGTDADGFRAATALVHADPGTPDLAELIVELAERTSSGFVFGGLPSSRGPVAAIAEGVYRGGLSGVAFGPRVAIVSRVSQGCQPVGPTRRITASDRNLVTQLDGEPALDLLLDDLGLSLERPREALQALRGTLVGLSDEPEARPRPAAFGEDVRVRHLIGLDPGQRGVALAEIVQPGERLAFCRRDVEAARRDLVRICAEIRDELAEPAEGSVGATARRIAGAIYVSCNGRGGPHFGGESAELLTLQHALGDVPLAGFFAAGEIGHRHLYGYTGVLTVFTLPD